MSTHALAPRLTAVHVPHPIEAVIADAGHRSRGAAVDLTPVLLRYWRELPHVTTDGRRRWLAATRAPGPGVREAFAATENELVLPGGWYRNQFWVIPGTGGPVLVCLGIHGQLVYADRAARTVVVKLSSWPDPQHTGYLLDTLRACAALAAHLSAGV